MLFAACRRDSFSLSGSVTAAPRLQTRFDKPNTVLILVAVNEGGVPIAVKRIVNPRLPLRYRLTDADLILPGKPRWSVLSVRVHVNQHGKIGQRERGDLRGVHKGLVRSGAAHVNIVIDEET